MKRAITSASNLSRRSNCAGSEALEAPFPNKDTEYSAEGTLLHSLFFADQKTPGVVTVDQIELVLSAERYARKFFEDFCNARGIPADAEYTDAKEIELMIVDADGNDLLPGHADIIRTWPDYHCAAVADAKFGYLEVTDAADNLQMAAYSVAWFQQSPIPLDAIGVAIVSPRAMGERCTSAIYTSPQIACALDEIKRIVDAAKLPGAPLKAGDWCQYCKAKVTCPAYAGELAALDAPHAVQTLAPDQLARLKDAIALADKIKFEVNDELRARIERGEMPGWKLKSNGSVRELFDATGAFLHLNEWLEAEGYSAMSAKAFDECRKLVFGSIEETFAAITGMAKSRAKDKLKDVLSPFVVETPKAMSPAREKIKDNE